MELDLGMERVVAVDWSGDKGPGQRKKLWAGVWTAATGKVWLESGRTREELMGWLVELGRERNIPLMEDLGSGALFDLRG